jgi:PAS domain S-box-containing protein
MGDLNRIILILDSAFGRSETYTEWLQHEANFTWEIVDNVHTQLSALSQTLCIDGILLELPEFNTQGLKVLEQLKGQLGSACPPVITVGDHDLKTAIAAFKAGAADYLVKEQLTPDALCTAFRTVIENADLKRELQISHEQFQTSVENMLDCFGVFSSIRDESGQIVDFRIDYLNEAACANNHMTREQQVGRGLCEVLPGHRASGLFDEYCQLVETGELLVKESVVYEDVFDGERLARAFDIRANKFNDGFVASWRDITDRKQLELKLSDTVASLQQQTTYLQQLLNTAPIGIGIGSPSGDVRLVNDTMLSLHGLTRDDFERDGLNWCDFTPPEYADRIEPAMAQLRQQGFLPPEEKEIQRPDGTRVPLWISATQASDNPDEHVAFAVDLIAQKRTEAALKASQQRYQELTEAMPQMVWRANATGAVNYWNQRWYAYTGLSETASFNLGGADVLHPADRDRTLTRWTQAITEGKVFEIEHRIRRQDGAYRWFINRGIPTHDDQGHITGWIGTITDIEAQKRLEEKLQLVLKAVDSLVFDFDLETHHMNRSEQLFDLLGYRPEEVPASIEWWLEQMHPEDRARLQPQTQALLTRPPEQREADLLESEYRVRHKNGHWVYVWDRSCLVRNDQGQIVRVVGSTLDVSSLKQTETALRQSEDRLRLALKSEQTAREVAENANRIKDEFLAILSHELRSPLNPILGWASLLQTRQLDADKTARALATIERNAKLQTQLIDDLLDVARILRGKLKLETTLVDPAFVIESALETVQSTAAEKRITIQTHLSPVGQIRGDAGRLQQIIWNLLTNAVKFTAAGGRVEVRLGRVVGVGGGVGEGGESFSPATQPPSHPATSPTSPQYAQITISDTGVGIRPDFLPHIFESFRQEDTSVTRQFGGLGLGLAIVRYLVEAHGGTIAADSPGEGRGATFTVNLPLADGGFSRSLTNKASAPDLDLTGVRVLAVDDNSDALELLAASLEQYGAEVRVLTNVSEVLATLARFKPNVLLCDIGMPNLDGHALMQQIRALPPDQGGQVPAIAVTAYVSEGDYQKALNSGFQKHVAKPVEVQALVLAVAELA